MEINFITINIILSVVGLLYYWIKSKYSFWKTRGVPYVEPTIPYGNFKEVNRTVLLFEWLQDIYKDFKDKTPFVGVYILFKPAVIICDLDLIKNILIKDFHNFTDRALFHNERDDPLSGHLFALDGNKWRNLRNKLSPTFTSGKMKFMFPTLLEVSKEFDKTLTDMVSKNNIIEIKELLARYTTDIIGTCAFGIDCNSLKDPNAEFRLMGKRVFSKQRHGPFGQAFTFAFPVLAEKLRFKQFEDVIIDFFMKVVRETVQYRETNKIQRNDFLDLLITIKNDSDNKSELGGMTIEELAAQVFIFFLAGFETSSTTMGFLLYEIAQNHDIQDKMRDEINQVLKENKSQFSYEGMKKLTYMDQVISETLRKYPPVVNLLRSSLSDYQVDNCKHIIPKGTAIFIPVHAIQHNPEIYPEPEKFDPDRFTPEGIKSRHSCTFLSFGDGPRNCIGLRFGKMQTKVGLVTLLKKFKFSVCDDTPIPLEYDIKNPLLGSKGGISLTIEKV